VNLESVATRAVFYDARDGHPVAERRVRGRIRLRCPLCILMEQGDARVLSTVTENLSSGGFCCVLEEPLAEGERVACLLSLPLRPDPQRSQALRCQAEVVWVTAMEDGRFHTGCRIDDYTVVA
jgi:PilZ domain-containing protein